MQSTRNCSFGTCGLPVVGRGLCNGHYKQNRKGWTLRPLLSQVTLEQRFLAKVNKTAGCWEWTGAVSSTGYGQFKVDGQMRNAHRISWNIAHGEIPIGMFLDHICTNPLCVNPEHLRIVTNAQNQQHLKGARSGSVTGIRNVYWDKRDKKWIVRVTLNGRQYSGGSYSTVQNAAIAAKQLRAELFTHDDYDEWITDRGRDK